MTKKIHYSYLGLVNTKAMFAKAMDEKFAVPPYNFNNLKQLQAIVKGCADTRSAVIPRSLAVLANISELRFFIIWPLAREPWRMIKVGIGNVNLTMMSILQCCELVRVLPDQVISTAKCCTKYCQIECK